VGVVGEVVVASGGVLDVGRGGGAAGRGELGGIDQNRHVPVVGCGDDA
jgi:hypothetical protein